jgi:hypothetical protein
LTLTSSRAQKNELSNRFQVTVKRYIFSHLGGFWYEFRGSGKKGGMTENQDIGNGYIRNPIYPGLKSISDMSISGMSIFIAIKWTYQK